MKMGTIASPWRYNATAHPRSSTRSPQGARRSTARPHSNSMCQCQNQSSYPRAVQPCWSS